jgi:protein-tyrosine-phosphatase
MKERVLILCAGNSARSQMAEGLLAHDGESREPFLKGFSLASLFRANPVG